MKQAPWIIIIMLVALLGIQRECSRMEPVVEHIYQNDTIWMPGDTVLKPYPVVEIDTNYITIYDSTIIIQQVDTTAILRDYFTHRYSYNNVLVDDSNTFVSIDWHVNRNRLISVKPYVINRKPTAYITTIQEVEKKRNRYFAGIGIGRSPSSFGLAPSVALLTKREHLYSIHYDVLNKDFYFTMYWKIR